jgi:hypothetical protein
MVTMSDDPNADYVIANIPLTGPGAGYEAYMSVPIWTIDDAIAVLQCHVARYSVGTVPDDTGLSRLMLATCRTLAALLEAKTARADHYGTFEMLEQLDYFLGFPDAREHLEAMRERRVDPDIVDALLALEPRVKAKRPQPPPASARRPEPQKPAEGEDHGRGQ